MRRERRKQENKDKIKNIMYLGGSILGIATIAFILTFVIYGNNLDKQQAKIDTEKLASLAQNTANAINTETASTEIGKTVEESKSEMEQNKIENTTTNTVSKKDNTVTNTTNKETIKNEVTKTTTAKEEKTEDPTFVKPVEGEICKDYAKDNLVYSETLGEWTTHLGIDIKAEKTTVVKAACDGKVKSIKTDPRYGLSITIEHQNGFETLYSNLLTSEFVQVGEEVKKGQTIGTVGNTATFEIADATHLHFEISKNGEKLDPNLYIK